MAAQRRRLTQDYAAIRATPPPDYFFLDSGNSDDLTGLSIYLVGPTSTPFESGVFQISLRIPATYPREPPKANFHTKIFHPNVDDRTGDVCVDTLKRDWNPKLTLHDVLVTIRCLLVYPNPTSSLNEAAGKLLLEDYDRFAKHAKLMTEVHAPVTAALKSLVDETRSRPVEGEEQIPKTLASGGNGNTVPAKPVVSSPQHRHRRQPSKPCNNGTFVIRKIKRATSPQAKPTSPGVDSDSDSGKENVMRRPSSPTGIKRTRDENAELAKPEDNEKGALSNDIAEASGRKSPKLKEDTRITPNTPKDAAAKPKYATPKKLINTASMKKKPTAKIGLKRF